MAGRVQAERGGRGKSINFCAVNEKVSFNYRTTYKIIDAHNLIMSITLL